MIFLFFLQILLNVVNWLATVIPSATTLPWGLDAIFSNGIGYLRFFITYIPPLGTLLTAFLIYLGIIIVLKIIGLIPIVRNILT